MELVFAGAVVIAAGTLLTLGYIWGRHVRQVTLRIALNQRRFHRRIEDLIMADLSQLRTEVQRLIVLVQSPRPEDPAIQAEIDTLTAEVKAAADAAGPSA